MSEQKKPAPAPAPKQSDRFDYSDPDQIEVESKGNKQPAKEAAEHAEQIALGNKK